MCVYAISGGTGAHMADMAAAAGLRLPPLTKETQQTLHDGLIPSYLRVSNPVDCGGPPVADERGRKILDAIVADPNVDIARSCPSPAPSRCSQSGPSRDLPIVAQQTDKPIFVVWGSPPGTDDTYYHKLLDGGLPVFRTFGNCVTAVQRVLRLLGASRAGTGRRSPTHRRTPLPAAKQRPRRSSPTPAPGATLSEHASKQMLKAYGIRTVARRAVHQRRRSRAAPRSTSASRS